MSLEIRTKSPLEVTYVPAFEDNYIWFIHARQANSREIIIVDPGDAQPVLTAIKQFQYQPKAIFITHHHGDHCGGIRQLLHHYKIPVYGPANESIPDISHPLQEGDVIPFTGMQLEFSVLDVPGHTRGHIAYHGHQVLFIGDTLFAAGCGRVFGGTYQQLYEAMEKIRQLDDNTLIYCAHEYTQDNLKFAILAEPDNPQLQQRVEETARLRSQNQPTVPSVLKLEKQTNPFLRYDQPQLIQQVNRFHDSNTRNPAEIFRLTRIWKDIEDSQ